ncbi:ferredoxin [Eremomyces bilateralis CBS 781.70]|uniref:Ferredoxin n=1 Tax=Eremomyces bilateralis CBS 781.70 TaxID=1392243 RepID=A0A6G1G2R2_9PEZI|nr:ferredoxin [Eremomyces bilateralis CBS 781.70]KAF1812333.1 ferredoxin [Eremomyces bilateralis CBS 781.70]
MSIRRIVPDISATRLRRAAPNPPHYAFQHFRSMYSTIQSATRITQPSRARRVPSSSQTTPSTQWRSARRTFTTSSTRSHAHLTPPKPGEERHVTFIDKDGSSHTFTVADGDNLLDIAQANDLEMEGACGGSCACSTCHVVVDSEAAYDVLPEPSDDENDMLDLAFGLTETSRLGCQVLMSKEVDGIVVRLPSMTRNLQKSDFEK